MQIDPISPYATRGPNSSWELYQKLQMERQLLNQEFNQLNQAMSPQDAAYKILNYIQNTPEPLMQDNEWTITGDGGGACFVTTATLRAIKSADDQCEELVTFRRFRDEFMMTDRAGMALVKVYYRIAPPLVRAIDDRRDKQRVYSRLWDWYLAGCYEFLKNKEHVKARDLYVQMIADLALKYPSGLAGVGR